MNSAQRHAAVRVVAAVFAVGLSSCTPTTEPGDPGEAKIDRSRSYVAVDFPGSVFTSVWGISPDGQAIVGAYRNEDWVVHGFLWRDGRYETIDYPGAAGTIATGINNRGEVVGWYDDAFANRHGYLLSGGRYVGVDAPCPAYALLPCQTMLLWINDAGDLAGAINYDDGGTPGFVRANGQFAFLRVPDNGEYANMTVVQAVSSSGDIAGFYWGWDAVHGFLLHAGTFTTIDFPGSASTSVFSMNDAGDVFGFYDDGVSQTHAFLLRGGHFTRIDIPGSQSTFGRGIDASGEIVGQYTDADGATHGFRQRK